GARRRRDLEERELSHPARLELEQALDRHEALEDSLGIVEAVDADAELHALREPEALAHPRAALRHRRLELQRRRRPFDRDRVAAHLGWIAAVGDGEGLAVDA